MPTTIGSYLQISMHIDRSQAATAARPSVAHAIVAFKAGIAKVSSISDFVNNYPLFSFAMKAFGLADMTYAKGFMQKVLEGGVGDPKSLANSFADPRFRAFAKAFDFAGRGAAAATSPSTQSSTVANYIRQTLEDDAGQGNEGVQLALYFQRKAPAITSAYGILGDKALLKVVQTALNIPAAASVQNIALQAQTITGRLNIHDFQNPSKIQALLSRFAANWDINNGTALPVSMSLPISQKGATGMSTDLLLSIQGLRSGGR